MSKPEKTIEKKKKNRQNKRKNLKSEMNRNKRTISGNPDLKELINKLEKRIELLEAKDNQSVVND